jgi:hypothetical protein
MASDLGRRWTPERQAQAVAEWRRRQEEALHYPAVSLHLYANATGVHCHASVSSWTQGGQLRKTVIAAVSWKPPEVSERLVVEWGARALTSWLEGSLTPPEDPS